MSKHQIMILELQGRFQKMNQEMEACIERMEKAGFQSEDFKGAKKTALLKEAGKLNLSAEKQTATYLRAEQVLLSEKQITRKPEQKKPVQVEEKTCGLPIEAILQAGWQGIEVPAKKVENKLADRVSEELLKILSGISL